MKRINDNIAELLAQTHPGEPCVGSPPHRCGATSQPRSHRLLLDAHGSAARVQRVASRVGDFVTPHFCVDARPHPGEAGFGVLGRGT